MRPRSGRGSGGQSPAGRPQGQLRRSQLVQSYGPGAMLDLPLHSVIVSGLENWGDPIRENFREVIEERLLAKVQTALSRPGLRMYSPPIDTSLNDERPKGITAWQFPEWFVAQLDEPWGENMRSRRLVHRRDLVRGKFLGPDKKRHPVVPIRFVRACINGHIGDIDWPTFAHDKGDTCRRPLWLDERGTSGDFTDIFVRCECGRANRSLAKALPAFENAAPLGFCDGSRPWLGAYSREHCGGEEGSPQPNRLLVRTASNAYFPQVLSVISIPEGDVLLRKAVDEIWSSNLQYVEDLPGLVAERRRAQVAAVLQGFSDAAVWADIARRRSGVPTADKTIKEAEIETMLAQTSIELDQPEANFSASTVPIPANASKLMKKLDRIVLVHRLREVTAQIGFTRFESATPDIDGELGLEVRRAPLSREAPWVPAVENKGEGFLLAFDEQALDDWTKRPAVGKRLKSLRDGFDLWKQAHPKVNMEFPGPRYILLHSLSHLLLSAVSLACGYAASSIRERIYVTNAGSGILLYTATPDSEGTLGGLVEVGRNVEQHLRAALEAGALCSNDPVCAQHSADNKHEERFVHGAACHGCLLIAEPSCERRNEFLDRALVVATVDDLGAELFSEADF